MVSFYEVKNMRKKVFLHCEWAIQEKCYLLNSMGGKLISEEMWWIIANILEELNGNERKESLYFHLSNNWDWLMLNIGLHLPGTGWLEISETITG